MTFEAFNHSLAENEPEEKLNPLLKALWFDGKGNWEMAHDIAQEKNLPEYCLIHAYLHRKEGDTWNAAYWYKKAGKTLPSQTLTEEWEDLVKSLLYT
jgi:hypothetical protein